MINTPLEFVIFVGLLFCLLIALAAWGNTFLMFYDEKDKSYVRREAIKTGIRVFVGLAIIMAALILIVPHIQ